MWNHRIMRHKDEDGTEWYGVHEVFYDDDGKIFAWTEEKLSPFGETSGELQDELNNMLGACDSPILAFDMEPEAPSPIPALATDELRGLKSREPKEPYTSWVRIGEDCADGLKRAAVEVERLRSRLDLIERTAKLSKEPV